MSLLVHVQFTHIAFGQNGVVPCLFRLPVEAQHATVLRAYVEFALVAGYRRHSQCRTELGREVITLALARRNVYAVEFADGAHPNELLVLGRETNVSGCILHRHDIFFESQKRWLCLSTAHIEPVVTARIQLAIGRELQRTYLGALRIHALQHKIRHLHLVYAVVRRDEDASLGIFLHIYHATELSVFPLQIHYGCTVVARHTLVGCEPHQSTVVLKYTVNDVVRQSVERTDSACILYLGRCESPNEQNHQ